MRLQPLGHLSVVNRIGRYTQERAAQTTSETFFVRLFVISILGASSHKPQLETICLGRSIDRGAGIHWGFATTKEFEILEKAYEDLAGSDTAGTAADRDALLEADAAAAVALDISPFADEAGRGGTFVLSTT